MTNDEKIAALEAENKELKRLLQLHHLKVGGIIVCIGHGMKVSDNAVKEAFEINDEVFDYFAKECNGKS